MSLCSIVLAEKKVLLLVCFILVISGAIISAIKKDPPTIAPKVRHLGRVTEFNGTPFELKKYASRDPAKTPAENALIVA